MIKWLLQSILTLFGISDWLQRREAEQVGEQTPEDSDLKAQNQILKKELDAAAHYSTDEDETKRFQEG